MSKSCILDTGKVWSVFVFFVLLYFISNPCRADDCNNKIYFSEDENITVTGTIESIVFWGPPNFGENPKTDQKYTGAILRLDCPIYIPENLTPKSGTLDGNVFNSVNENSLVAVKNNKITVVNIRMEADYSRRIAYKLHDGRHAKITGTLREMILPSDHTPVVLDETDTEWLAPPKNSRNHEKITGIYSNSAIDDCASKSSGAGLSECLENIFLETQQDIRRSEKAVLYKLKKQRQAGDLMDTNYELAVSSLNDASKKFAKFSERQCDFAVGASGAVASGSSQVRWRCLIRLNDWRIQYLKSVLPKK